MRLFFAIDLSPEMKGEIVRYQNELYESGVRGNFTSEENLHLTLAFIGEYPDPDAVMDSLAEFEFTPFPLELNGVGSFDDLWWVGLSDSPALNGVVRRLRRALAEAGIPFDKKRFSPHITVLRRASEAKMPPIELGKISMTADKITLFRSERGKKGMIYTGEGAVYAAERR